MSKKKKPVHPHPKADTMLVVLVPADESQEIQFKMISGDLDSMQQLVGGYIERVLSSIVLPCGCNTALIVNEEARLKQSPLNNRASNLVTHEIRRGLFGPILGDVFLVGEGPVLGSEGEARDWFTMPPTRDVVKFIAAEAR